MILKTSRSLKCRPMVAVEWRACGISAITWPEATPWIPEGDEDHTLECLLSAWCPSRSPVGAMRTHPLVRETVRGILLRSLVGAMRTPHPPAR